METKVDTFIKDLANGKFPDDAIEKMFLNLRTVYKVKKEGLSLAFNAIMRLRPILASSIMNDMKSKFDKAYDDHISLVAGSKMGIGPNKIKTRF